MPKDPGLHNIPGPYAGGYVFPDQTGKHNSTNTPGPWASGYTFPDAGNASGQAVLVRGNGPHKFQPDFPAAAQALPMLRKGKLTRGYIAQDRNDPLVNGTPLGFQFLYNPTEWEQDYSLDTSRYPSNAAPQGGSTLPTIGVPGASSLGLNLILDRTWDVNNPNAGEAYRRGIRADVEQFEKMVGYTARSPFVQAVSLRMVFSKTLTYYGFITNFAVLYSQFTTDMRCYRGGITGITFQVLPDVPGGGTFSTVPDQPAPGASAGNGGGGGNTPGDNGTGRTSPPTVPHGA